MLTLGAGNIPSRTFIVNSVEDRIVMGKLAELLVTVTVPVNGTLMSADENGYTEPLTLVLQRAFAPIWVSI